MQVEFSSTVIACYTWRQNEQHPWPGATVLRSGDPQGTEDDPAQGSRQAQARQCKTKQDRQTQWQTGGGGTRKQ